MDEMEYNYVKRQVKTLLGIDLNSYKAAQMQRRLKAYLARSGYQSWPRFFRVIGTDQVQLGKLKDYLTINVSAFFRDPEKYNYLQTEVLPELLRRRSGLRVWSAGCARGQEPYSLAILLAEAGGSPERRRILATDIDRQALDWARAGGPYTGDDVANLPATLRLTYFNLRQEQYWIRPDLASRIMFRQHNLLADSIAGRFDLIVCRNVVIYFQPAAKEDLYRRFYEALNPGGVLFVGGTEMLPRTILQDLEMTHSSFYRRPDYRRSPARAR